MWRVSERKEDSEDDCGCHSHFPSGAVTWGIRILGRLLWAEGRKAFPALSAWHLQYRRSLSASPPRRSGGRPGRAPEAEPAARSSLPDPPSAGGLALMDGHVRLLPCAPHVQPRVRPIPCLPGQPGCWGCCQLQDGADACRWGRRAGGWREAGGGGRSAGSSSHLCSTAYVATWPMTSLL